MYYRYTRGEQRQKNFKIDGNCENYSDSREEEMNQRKRNAFKSLKFILIFIEMREKSECDHESGMKRHEKGIDKNAFMTLNDKTTK